MWNGAGRGRPNLIVMLQEWFEVEYIRLFPFEGQKYDLLLCLNLRLNFSYCTLVHYK